MNLIEWAKPADEILATLLTEAWVPTNAVITVAAIVDAVGGDAARLVVGTLQAGAAKDPLLAASWQALSTVGMSLSGEDRQAMIDQLAMFGYGPQQDQPWPTPVRDAVKALGGVSVGRWSQEGFSAEPTLAQVEQRKAAELARIEAERIAAEKQAAIAANRQAYAKLREDWIQVYSRGLRWINSQEHSLATPPTMVQVFEEVR